jgi:hypothetical protein
MSYSSVLFCQGLAPTLLSRLYGMAFLHPAAADKYGTITLVKP